MAKSKKVTFSVTSYEGDTEYSLVPKEALAKIKQLQKEESKWVFVDGEHKNAELITEGDLATAAGEGRDITLVNAIAGGDCGVSKPVEINFEVVKKSTKLEIDLDVNEYRTMITINVPESRVIDFLYDRVNIYRAIKVKLDELAGKQVDDMRTALNY